MNDPELLPNGSYGPEFGSFGQVVRNVEVYNPMRTICQWVSLPHPAQAP